MTSLSSSYLIVVHAQPEMVAQVPGDVTTSLCQAVKTARSDRRSIVFLELADYEPTLSGLVATADGAPVLSHDYADGSEAFCRYLEDQELSCSDVILCGFFAHACVYDTAAGLRARLPQVRLRILRNACDPSTPDVWARLSAICPSFRSN